MPRIPMLMLVLLAMTGCGIEDALIGKDCTSDEDQSWDISNPDQPTAFKIDQCRLDADACKALCSYVMSQKQVSFASGPTNCDVTFDGDTTHITASYVVNNDAPGCAIPEQANF